MSEWVSYWQALPMIGLGSDKNGFNTFWHQTLKYSHMGQIPQDGENGQNVAFSYFFEAQLWPNGSRWARTKTKTFLESNGENLIRTVEKS